MKIRLSEIRLSVATTALVLALVIPAGARDSNKRRQKDKAAAPSNSYTNVCDITDRESKVHCYCENTQVPGNANKAECWVFNGGISKDDPIWPSFHTQHNLQILSFNVRADGGLSFVPSRALRHLHQLQVLNIKYANIHEVTSHSFANLSSITEMSLSKNQIVTLKKYAFAHLLNLTQVTLDENKITDIAKDAFFDLPVLQKLYFTNNSLTTIHGGIFKALVNLVELEMDRNLIATLSRESFDGLANLKRLDLRRNKLESLKDFTFAELWNLQDLFLDHNALHSISERTFDGLSQLKRLSLSHNKITGLISGLFEGVRGLNSLDLRYNFLKTLTFENVRPIYDNLKVTSSYLYLGGNDLTCDCRLQWMHSLRNETKSGKIRNALEGIKCMLDETILMGKQDMNKYTRISDTNDIEKSKKIPDNDDEPDLNFNDDDDETLQDSANVGNIATIKPNDGGQKRLLNVPIDLLPCPQTVLKSPTDSPFTYPSQNEVKDYRNIHIISSSSGSEHLTYARALLVLCFIVQYFMTQ